MYINLNATVSLLSLFACFPQSLFKTKS